MRLGYELTLLTDGCSVSYVGCIPARVRRRTIPPPPAQVLPAKVLCGGARRSISPATENLFAFRFAALGRNSAEWLDNSFSQNETQAKLHYRAES